MAAPSPRYRVLDRSRRHPDGYLVVDDMRRAAKVDLNQAQIVLALRKAGAKVEMLHQLGNGIPDILVGFRGQLLLMEIKDGSLPPSGRKLTPDEQEWHDAWNGYPVYVINSVTEALDKISGKE